MGSGAPLTFKRWVSSSIQMNGRAIWTMWEFVVSVAYPSPRRSAISVCSESATISRSWSSC